MQNKIVTRTLHNVTLYVYYLSSCIYGRKMAEGSFYLVSCHPESPSQLFVYHSPLYSWFSYRPDDNKVPSSKKQSIIVSWDFSTLTCSFALALAAWQLGFQEVAWTASLWENGDVAFKSIMLFFFVYSMHRLVFVEYLIGFINQN